MIPKVVHSSPVWLPQTQTWIYNQVRTLQQLGIDAHVVCERTNNLDRFAIANIHSFENEPHFKQVWDKKIRGLRFRRHLNYLVETGRSTGANIIHSHFGDIGWANRCATRKLKVKHVVTFYGQDVNRLPIQRPIWRVRYRKLFADVDLVFCEGSHMARCIVELGCPEDKVKVQHLGVEVDNIHFEPRQWHADEPLRVLIAASFREKKGIPYAIKALQIVAGAVPIRLTIIGDAGSQQEKTRIHAALERGGLIEHTRMLGFQTHKAMLREAYDHHLFLQPSVTARDGDTEGGAPVSIIEMLATGMPVVATSHCDIPEVVGPAFSHLLAPERDFAKLAECIQLLLDQPDSWSSLVLEGRRRVETEYHLLRQTERLTDYYKELFECK